MWSNCPIILENRSLIVLLSPFHPFTQLTCIGSSNFNSAITYFLSENLLCPPQMDIYPIKASYISPLEQILQVLFCLFE